MFYLKAWDSLGVIALIFLLAALFIGRSSIRAVLIVGIYVSIAIWVINIIFSIRFSWHVYKDILIVSILAGALYDVISFIVQHNPTKRMIR